MDSDSAVKLNMIRLARRLLRQAKAREESGESAGAHRRAFSLLIRALRVAIDGGISPERLTNVDELLNRFTGVDSAEANTDGGAGSGNWGHAGRPGKVGGSGKGGGVHNRTGTKESGYSSAAKERAKEKAAKSVENPSAKNGGSHPVAQGKNIVASYTGSGDIKSVIHAQGFDGLPKCVGRKEFDKAVESSNFIAQRTYAATSQEVLDAYHDQLCNGEWYIECTEGGAFYGQGMYCAADYTGKLSERIQSEMALYTQIGRNEGKPYAKIETLTLDPGAKIISYKEVLKAHKGELTDERASQFVRDYAEPKLKSIGEKYGEQAETAARWKFGESDIPWEVASEAAKSVGEEVTAKIVEEVDGIRSGAYGALNAYRNQFRKESEEIRKKYGDVGAYAAALGYDAINADVFGVSHTVILNRTKTIILDESVHNKDGAEHAVRFQLGADGVIYAIKDRKVIGCVYVHGASDDGTGGGSASGDANQDAQNRYNFVTPIDKSPHSDIIKLENPNTDGGLGSGNFGHKGVPGRVGGSAPSNGANASSSSGGTGNSTGNASSSTSASSNSGSGSTGNATGTSASSSSTAPASGKTQTANTSATGNSQTAGGSQNGNSQTANAQVSQTSGTQTSPPAIKVSARGSNTPCTGFANKAMFERHVNRHIAEFPGMTGEQYEQYAIDFLKQPCTEVVDGYLTKQGEVVRFDRANGEYAKGVPGGRVVTCYVARFNAKTGVANLEAANRYFDRLKEKEGV